MANQAAVWMFATRGTEVMLDADSQGLAGMDGSQGGRNMVPLVVASLTSGCTP